MPGTAEDPVREVAGGRQLRGGLAVLGGGVSGRHDEGDCGRESTDQEGIGRPETSKGRDAVADQTGADTAQRLEEATEQEETKQFVKRERVADEGAVFVRVGSGDCGSGSGETGEERGVNDEETDEEEGKERKEEEGKGNGEGGRGY